MPVQRHIAGVNRDWIYRIVGQPPGSGAARSDQLRWVRKFSWFGVTAIAVVALFAVATGGAFLWIVAGVGAICNAANWAWVTRKIRREATGPERP